MGSSAAEALQYLFGLEKLGIKFGLDNIRAICAALDHPEAAWPSVIIAGTNGKGSVAAMVEAGLRAAGRRTGLYTSPHLVRLEERFAIDGQPVATEALGRAAEDVRDVVTGLRATGRLTTDPTFFEVTTAIGFELFRRAAIDFAILEVGLGGRFDATNVARPQAAAITTIDFDHERFLGNTLAAIAAEKAGVIKPGMQVVVGETKDEPVEVIRSACREQGATMVAARTGVNLSVRREDEGLVLDLETPRRRYAPMRLALRGRHQVDNALVAVRLLETLEAGGVAVNEAAIAAAVTTAHWPGRLDLRTDARGRQVLFDAAHNPAGAAVLAAYLREFHPAGLPLVFGIMKDKDVSGTLGRLLPLAAPLILTRPPLERALSVEGLEQVARQLGARACHIHPDPRAALEHGWRHGPLVCVAGSMFLVGDVLSAFDRPGPTPPESLC